MKNMILLFVLFSTTGVFGASSEDKSVSSLIRKFNALSRSEDNGPQTSSGARKKVNVEKEKVPESSRLSSSKNNSALNITIRPVSIGNQIRGSYAGKSTAAVVIQTAQGEYFQLIENKRWCLDDNNNLFIYKMPHEIIAHILVLVNAYAYPKRILVIE